MKEIVFRTADEYFRFMAIVEEELLKRNMSYQELAEELDVSIRSLYNFRADRTRNPSRFLAAKVAGYLEIKNGQWRRY